MIDTNNVTCYSVIPGNYIYVHGNIINCFPAEGNLLVAEGRKERINEEKGLVKRRLGVFVSCLSLFLKLMLTGVETASCWLI